MKRTRIFLLLIALLSAVAITASCGGGGGGSSDSGGGGGGGGGGSATTIGPNGGTVTSSDGKASVNIPAGALSQETAITVDSIVSPGPGNIGTVYKFAPEGTSFNLPVIASIRYDDAALPQGVSEQNLKLRTFVNNQWQEVAGSTVDTALNIVSGNTTHFSDYAIANIIGLPKTGQTSCYDDLGTVISCRNGELRTGQDGDLRMGVAWPSPRFSVNGNTVTDYLTGLIWLKDARCINTQYPGFDTDGTAGDGRVTWQNALNFVAGINDGTYSNCGAGYTDWRIPNIKELKSLINNYEQANIATWLDANGFINRWNDYYWSSTTSAYNTNDAYYIPMWEGGGSVISNTKTNTFSVWPVRAGAGMGAPVDLPKTGQTISYAAGDDGDLQKGAAWPSPRFTVGTGAEADCVTDNLTGLMWARASNSTLRSWVNALSYAKGSLCGYDDWRLPNINELESLINAGQADTAAWLNTQGFNNVLNNIHWSSTTHAAVPSSAWFVIMWNGVDGAGIKSTTHYVLPVRAGQ